MDTGISDQRWIALDLASEAALRELGVEPVLPASFYDMESYNRISMEIYRSVMDAFSDCSTHLSDVGASKYLNIPAAFFHEILRILCAYYFKRYELDSLTEQFSDINTDGVRKGVQNTPYVDYDFVLDPVEPGRLQTSKDPSNLRSLMRVGRRLTDAVGNIGSLTGNSDFLLTTCGCPIDLRRLKTNLNGGGGKWSLQTLRPSDVRIVIPDVPAQLDSLKTRMGELSKRLDLKTPSQLFDVVSAWVRQHLVPKYSQPLKCDLLLIGSPVHPSARLAAARAKSESIPVVSVLHGESGGIVDEPVFGYGENTFMDTVVGYGEEACEKASDGEFTNSLFGDPVPHVPSSSTSVSRIYTSDSVRLLSEIESPTFMYVPTAFTGSGRYGPYRDIHDVAYHVWEAELMTLMGKQFPGRVVWKHHPTGLPSNEPSVPGVQIISGRWFEDMIEEPDVFLFDYLSTGFTQAAATSNPIIYLDIGFRNPTPSAKEALIDRSLYVKADITDPAAALRQAFEQSSKRCVNRYSYNFSLVKDSGPRESVIAETVQNMVGSGRQATR